ncbi:MAG: SDR family oxidoreductase [Bacteroidetes bacterium]|jgi:NAD(P)-dependent dehydrogenase (short-subunit alcohol dehydrogenase family)|nr:SDR family oxidoreductase [Bacteroidota bacterium]
MFTQDTLKGKNILITGGGGGLGAAFAERYAELGANLVLCGRTQATLDAAAERIRSHGTQVLTYATDIRDYEAVGRMFDHATAQLGPINGLMNNAGANFLAASEDLSPNGFKAIVDIVLHGTFNCTQHFGKRLIEQKLPGSVISIVTTYTETGGAFVLPSACAKAGVYALTNSLAYEWATYGIRVNSIAPGPFPTEGAWSRLMPSQQFEQAYVGKLPTGRVGEKWEIANLAVFLMSDLAPYITGECVVIDGGERLQGAEFNYIAQMAPREQLKAFFNKMKPA